MIRAGEGVTGLRAAEAADRPDVACDHARSRDLLCPERVREGTEALVLVMVLVAGVVGEEGGEVSRDVYGDVGDEGAGEDPDDAHPADVLVTAGAHDLGHQRPLGIAADGTGGGTGRGVGLRRGVLERGREAPHAQVEQLDATATVGGADGQHREQTSPGDRLLEVTDEEVLVDLLAAEVALHQRLVLGLLDHRLDQGSAAVVVALAEQVRDPFPGRHGDGQHPVTERLTCAAEGRVEVCARVVELADHHRAGHLHRGALVPQLTGAHVHGLVGGDHEESAVCCPQPGAHLTDEVGVTRRVEQVDLAAAVHHRRDEQRAGPSVRAVVDDQGGVLEDRSGAEDGTGRDQQRLDESGLAGLARADQHDVADLRW